MKSIYSYISPLIALLIAPSLAWAQVVIPGTGGAVVTPPAGARTSVIPGACTGTNKVTGITTTGAVQCNTDVTGTSSPLTTKGDLWGFSTVDGRIAVGSNDQCVVADSTAAFGIKWGSCAVGGSGITSLGAQTGSTQTFSDVDDTNVTLTIASAADNHAFTLGWTGTLADSRLTQITTASKVSGAAITLLTSVPSGAGNLPLVNIPDGTANQILGTDAAGTAAEHKSLATGTAGTNFAIAHTAGVVTFDLPVASGTNTGKLSSANWTTFNSKEDETHASEHQNAGGDEVATATAAANAIPKANASADLAPAWIITGAATASRCLRTDGTSQIVVDATDCAGADGVGYDEVLEEAAGLTKRAQTNFIGVDVTAVDNGGATRTDVTIIPVAEAYDATGWNADTGAASKDNIRDKIEALDFSDLAGTVGDAQIAAGAVDGGSGGEIADASIVSADLATANKTFKCNFVLFRDTGLKDTDDINSISNCSRPGRAITITVFRCETDAGSPVVNAQRDDGAPANLLTGNLTCTTGGADGTLAAAEDNFAATDALDFVAVSGMSGANRVSILVEYTVD